MHPSSLSFAAIARVVLTVAQADTSFPVATAPVAVSDYIYDDLDRLIRGVENLTVAEGGTRITDTIYSLDDTAQMTHCAVGCVVALTYAVYISLPPMAW